jgi:hypothetical protein
MSVLLAEADTVRPAKHVQKVVISNLALVRIQSGHRSRTGHVSFAPTWTYISRLTGQRERASPCCQRRQLAGPACRQRGPGDPELL